MAGLRERLTGPALVPILRDVRLSRAIAVATVLQLICSAMKITLIPCPVWELFKLPCPGCGLTRASFELFKGHFARSVDYHPLALPYLVGAFIILVAAVLPGAGRRRLITEVEGVERMFFPTHVIISLTVVYWVYRILYLADQTRSLL